MTLITRMEREPQHQPEHPRLMPTASQFLAFLAYATAIAGAWWIHPGLGLLALAGAMFITAMLIREVDTQDIAGSALAPVTGSAHRVRVEIKDLRKVMEYLAIVDEPNEKLRHGGDSEQ